MVAEAPDPHKGDLGRLEEVRNGLIGADNILVTKRVLNKIYLIALLKALEEEVGIIFHLNKHTTKP